MGLAFDLPFQVRETVHRGEHRSPNSMRHTFLDRAWHIAITVGPLIAIALALVAARRWY